MVVRGGCLFLVFGDRGKCDEVLEFWRYFRGMCMFFVLMLGGRHESMYMVGVVGCIL